VTVNDHSDRVLRAAMHRILAGTPIRSNGSFTVTALAAEAGVSRRTAARATTVLRDFRDAIEHRQTPPVPPASDDTPSREAIAVLRIKLRAGNAQIRRLRSDLAALACRVALLSEENAQLRTVLGRGKLVSLPVRTQPTPRQQGSRQSTGGPPTMTRPQGLR
jgi:hypothetical protein